jgi:serine/threonine protein kinase
VVDSLGEGRGSVVFRARDPRIGRVVAIKVQRPSSPERGRRFEHDARSAGNLTHANIVTIFDFGVHEGAAFLVMEYVQGLTLVHHIGVRAPLTLPTRIDLIDMLASGLGYGHGQGVIHRGITPSNLMVDQHGILKILDFGVAHEEDGGTVTYLSPEQVRGGEADRRSDVFSVGAVFYELLSYRPAFPGSTPEHARHRVLRDEPEPLAAVCPGMDSALDAIVAKALEKNPADRYQTLAEFRLDLARCRERLNRVDGPNPRERMSGSIADATAGPAWSRRSGQALLRHEIDDLLRQARTLMQRGDLRTAAAVAAQALQVDPESPDALRLYEDIVQAAAQDGERHQRSERVAALLFAARQSASRHSWDEAFRAASQALELDPDNLEASELTRGALVEMGNAFRQKPRSTQR